MMITIEFVLLQLWLQIQSMQSN